MVFKISGSFSCYFLPDDELEYVADINKDFKVSNTDIYISSFIITPSLFPELLNAAQNGCNIRILHDKTQWNKDQKERFSKLLATDNVEIVLAISTAQDEDSNTGYHTMHDKTVLIDTSKSVIYTGSTNFTFSGSQQVNRLFRFSNKTFRDNYLDDFNEVWEFSKKYTKQKL
jgi:phosphatidylserine/phosphatidylglycerophosphate/cardiolipin synthase-like enzyme